jgi:hypothetical protein
MEIARNASALRSGTTWNHRVFWHEVGAVPLPEFSEGKCQGAHQEEISTCLTCG